MKKNRLVAIFLMATLLIGLLMVGQAHAVSVTSSLPDGYTITTTDDNPSSSYSKDPQTGEFVDDYGTSYGGGSRTVSITTTLRSLEGWTIWWYRSTYSFSWSKGNIISYGYGTPRYGLPYPFIYYDGTSFMAPYYMYYYSRSHGQIYMGASATFTQQIPVVGKVHQWTVHHNAHLRGNGTWTWSAYISS